MDKLSEFFSKLSKRTWLISLAVFIAIVAPLLITDYLGYRAADKQLTELTLSRRESLAHLASAALKEKFDRIVDVGISLATRIQFQKFIASGQWAEAVKILEGVPRDFPYVDTVAIFDLQGTIRAITPPIPEVIGKNFAYRDYYQGVSKNWQPYVSEVFKRAVEPKYNVVSVAIPIKADSPTESDQKILGILLLTIKLDTILDWAREIEVGTGGFTYFVDRNGHVAGHPKFSSQDEVVDFSEVPVVKKVLQGERGVGIFYNQIEKEERISAYEQVPVYGWGAIVQQPTLTAFASRRANLQGRLIADGVTLLVACLLAYFILFFINRLNNYYQKEKIFLQSVGDGLIAIDRSWNITLWNEAAGNLTGWSRAEALGRPFRDLVKFIRESDKKENIAFIEEAMLFGKISLMEDHTLLMKRDGREIAVDDSAAPIFDQRGRVAGAIIIFRDISKQHKLEEGRQEFASLATHQLRTPITVIKGYTAMLLEENAPPLTADQKESLEAIHKAGESLNALVNSMLNVSRIELGTLAIEPQPAYLPDLADEVAKEISPQIAAKKLQLEKLYDSNLPSIIVDPALMGAIFRNLLSNAVKYTKDGGKITLKVEKQESDVLITVADTGVGIPKAQQSKMFTKFFRADNVASGQTEGTGLGLYIVKSIIEQSGGRVWFESEENKGATFYVTIPLTGMKKKEGIRGLT